METDRAAQPAGEALTPPSRARPRRVRRLVLAVLVSLLVSEGAVRVFEGITGTDHGLQLEARFTLKGLFQPHPYVGWILRPGARSRPDHVEQFQVNPQGFRGKPLPPEKSPRTFRVACLGGSTTYGVGCTSDDHTWPAQLEQRLATMLPEDGAYDRVEVLNAGVPSYTSMESFVNLKMRVMPFEPDLVIVYHGINDAHAMMSPGFRADYSHVRGPWAVPVPSRWDVLLGWSHLYGLLRGAQGVPTLHDVVTKPYLVDRPTEGGAWKPLATWRRTLRELTALSRANGCEVLLTSFAYTPRRPTEKPWIQTSGFRAIDTMNGATAEVARELGTSFADLCTVVGQDEALFVDPVHLSNAGNQAIAEELARVIADSGLLAGERP